MTIAMRTLLLLALLAGSADGSAEDRVRRAFEDLASPYLEARRQAALLLARGGPETVEELRGVYGRADFETKALILEAFAAAAPSEGLPLVELDLSTPDRGVVLAQRLVVSAAYARAREFARREIAAILPREEWRLEEHLRALPGPGELARSALEKLKRSSEGWRRIRAGRLESYIAAVDGLRESLAVARLEGSRVEVERAREIERLLLQRDVERVLLAILEAGGFEGHYPGMYAQVGALLDGPRKEQGFRILMRMIKDESLPEGGTAGPRTGGYEFREPIPAYLDELDVRRKAADCVGDIGEPALAAELAEFFGEFEPLDSFFHERADHPLHLNVALACAALGDRRPLEKVAVDRLKKVRQMKGVSSSKYVAELAEAYEKLGKQEEALEQHRRAVRDPPGSALTSYNLACAYSRMGLTEEALDALETAVELEYGITRTQLIWMDRDKDLDPIRGSEEYRRIRRRAVENHTTYRVPGPSRSSGSDR
jgi:tetratricopeptide (TPR) repeat protein